MKRKLAIVICLSIIAIFSLMVASAEPQLVYGGDNRSAAVKLEAGQVYVTVATGESLSDGWFCIQPSESGAGTLYNSCVIADTYYIEIYDSVGNLVQVSPWYEINDEGPCYFEIQEQETTYIRKRQIIRREISRHISLDSAISRYLQARLRSIRSNGTSESVFE